MTEEKDDVDIVPYRAPYEPLSGDEAEAMATALLGKSDTRVDDVGDIEITIGRTADGGITINGKDPASIDDNDRAALAALQAQDTRKARDEKEANDTRHVDPKSNPMIRLDSE